MRDFPTKEIMNQRIIFRGLSLGIGNRERRLPGIPMSGSGSRPGEDMPECCPTNLTLSLIFSDQGSSGSVNV